MVPSWAMRWKFPVKAEGEDRYLIEQLVSILLSYYTSGRLLEPPSLNGWLHWFLSLTIIGAAGSQGSGLSFWILSPLCARCCARVQCGQGRYSYLTWNPHTHRGNRRG